jgi:hypothetical protein
MSIKFNKTVLRKLRASFDGSESYMSGHQMLKVRRNESRKVPEWVKSNEGIQKVLMRSFPKMNERNREGYPTSQANKQREQAGVWVRFIQLYWRAREPRVREVRASGTCVITQQDIATEMRMTLGQLKSLRTRIIRAGQGVRTDGRGERKRKRYL